MEVPGRLETMDEAKKCLNKGVKFYVARPDRGLIGLLILKKTFNVVTVRTVGPVLSRVNGGISPLLGHKFDFKLEYFLPPLERDQYSLFTNFWFAYACYNRGSQ